MRGPIRILALMLCTVAAACSNDAVRGVPDRPVAASPALVSANDAVAVVVGRVITYDASKGGLAFRSAGAGSLRYQITFESAANGLTAAGSTVLGRPIAPGVTWATIVATDSLLRSATNRFPIVAFDSALATPVLPATRFSTRRRQIHCPRTSVH